MIRVLIADDQPGLRQRMVRLLKDAPDIAVVGEAEDGQAAVEFAQQLQPDVILMDIQMPRLDGLQATEQLKGAGHPARVLLISLGDSVEHARSAARCGANGLFLKGGTREELITAVRSVYGGQMYYTPALIPLLSDQANT